MKYSHRDEKYNNSHLRLSIIFTLVRISMDYHLLAGDGGRKEGWGQLLPSALGDNKNTPDPCKEVRSYDDSASTSDFEEVAFCGLDLDNRRYTSIWFGLVY